MLVGAGWVGLYPFVTNVRAERRQADLHADFEQRTAQISQDHYQAGKVREGSPPTRVLIPRVRVDTIVVEGTHATALAAGAGHYRDTPLPGENGNVAIAGHV